MKNCRILQTRFLYNHTVSAQAKEFLLNKGFKVSWFGGDQRDPCNDTTISWE